MIVLIGTKNQQVREAVERGEVIGVGQEVRSFKAYRKTVATYAILMRDPFEVQTIEGLHFG